MQEVKCSPLTHLLDISDTITLKVEDYRYFIFEPYDRFYVEII